MLAYPCKHFFAIFKKYASWDWNWLSKLYKNLPYSALDENVKDSTEFEAQPTNKNANDKTVHHQNIRQSYARGTSKQKREVKNRVHGDAYGSLLNEVKSLRFLNENNQEKINRVLSVL